MEEEEEEDDGGVPSLTSSQESASTEGPRTPMGNKRRFCEVDVGDEVGVGDGQGMRLAGLGERVLAVPRRRKWAGVVGKGQGQENVGVGTAVGVVGQDVDFEDADFLDYGLVMDGEVEMGGV
jgi:hypothetical protein